MQSLQKRPLHRPLLPFCALAALACLAPGASAAAQENVSARGVVRSLAETSVATDLVARIARIGFREGETFQKGDELVGFDCTRYDAEFAAAKAEIAANAAQAESNQEMRRFKAIGAKDVAISEAKTNKARAEADIIRTRLGQCSIKAPFSGRVVEKTANEFDIPAAMTPLLKIVDHKRMEIEMIAPSKWLSWLAAGQTFKFNIEDIGLSLEAKVVRIGASVDAVSQTVRVIGAFTQPSDKVLPGMSGRAEFAAAVR